MDPIDTQTLVASLVTFGTTIGAVLFALRRRASRDTVEIVKDRAEESVIVHLERQRDSAVKEVVELNNKLRICEAEKLDAITKVAKLTTEMEHLTGQVRILRELVERLGKNLDATRDELHKYVAENAKLLAKVEILESTKHE